MKTAFLACFWLLVSALAGEAKLIPPHRMDWYTAVARDVVLCEEEKVEIKKIAHHPPESSQDWTEIRTEVTCKVVRVFKGDLQPGAILHVDYEMVFYRVLVGGEGYTQKDATGKVLGVVQPQYLPAGRALLFLDKSPDKATYDVVTAKLIQKDGVYQFLQAGNPGPLELMCQQPENFHPLKSYKNGVPETEEDLVEDELIAVKKAVVMGPSVAAPR